MHFLAALLLLSGPAHLFQSILYLLYTIIKIIIYIYEIVVLSRNSCLFSKLISNSSL